MQVRVVHCGRCVVGAIADGRCAQAHTNGHVRAMRCEVQQAECAQDVVLGGGEEKHMPRREDPVHPLAAPTHTTRMHPLAARAVNHAHLLVYY
jgi:hypothetical protein